MPSIRPCGEHRFRITLKPASYMDAYFCLDNSPAFELIELETTDSTNNFLKNYRPLQPREMTLVTAEYQQSGRGQTGNHWESEPGRNLLFSLLIHPRTIEAAEQFILSQAIAVAVKRALEDFVAPVSLKWPNDIYYGDCKLGGILIENDLVGRRIANCILGVGLNINQTDFHSGAPNPISLKQILGHEVERRFVLERVVGHFSRLLRGLGDPEKEALREAYARSLYRREGWHAYADAAGPFRARLEGVAPDGHLLLRDEQGTLHTYAFKEVTFLFGDGAPA